MQERSFKSAREKKVWSEKGFNKINIVINDDTIKDLYPDRFNVLRSSQNLDVRNRNEEQVKSLSSVLVEA